MIKKTNIYQKHFGKENLKIIILVILFLILLPSCSTKAINEDVLFINSANQWLLYDINAITWSPNSFMFAVAGKEDSNDHDFGIYAYDITSLKKKWFKESSASFSLGFNFDEKNIAVPFFAGYTLFDSETGTVIDYFLLQTDVCFGSQEVAFDSNENVLITLSTVPEYKRTTIYFWNIETDKCLNRIEEEGVGFDFDISQDAQYLVLALSEVGKKLEKNIHLWDLENETLLCDITGSSPIAFTRGGTMIASGNISNESKVDLWDAKNCSFLFSLPRQEDKTPYSMDFSPDGSLLAVGSSETFEIWDVVNQELLFVSEKLPNSVSTLLFSPDGKYLLTKTDRTSTDDKAIITLWSIEK